jgi:hypothetical protein
MISLLVTCAIRTLQARCIVVEYTRYGCYKKPEYRILTKAISAKKD